MKYMIGLMAMLLPILSACAQESSQSKTISAKRASAAKKEIEAFYIGDRVPDLPLKNILNYKDSVGNLSSFGDKIIILDFWNTYCTSCIRMFPLEDSLQAMFPNDLQFILITDDSKEKVARFLSNYNRIQNKPLSLPIITNDRVFRKLFRFTYIPHYVWLAPNGLILAQASDCFISQENIANALISVRAEEQRLHGNKYADFNLHMQKPAKELLQLLSLTDH
jgi:thiol-disulfide isomerase/thioredoxin